ncbi:Coenzyme F_390 synthetase [Labilithrix luteola]|uniref:Coenzyme F_390 synthetase n=1 Tax=Labilithrix luteola TaxID=1391654 RepID=A0A0K1PVW8_9BACT|nr:phenylacetate--CoA ligase family protein [Labilithrix luteola]AKU97667.1 Coenzyme F_390 synthetase [Labilithrix luteola]
MNEARRDRVRAAFDAFLGTSLDDLFKAHRAEDPVTRALDLFHETARDVPAYGAFLDEHGIDPARLRTREDFERLPLLTKDGYLRKYPLASRCRKGDIFTSDTIAVSSGSTGEPTFWPRSMADELTIARRFEQIFADSFGSPNKRTLAVVCFPLGTWVGGMFTTACVRHLASKGHPIFTVTPGNVKAEILRVVTALAPQFEQTVLLGYPPFLKDVVDTGIAAGIPWSEYAIKLVLAGEVFTEQWRTLMGERAGMKQPLLDSASLYGTADAGVLGNETPVSIAIRRFLADRPDDARAIFGEARLPTLVQFDPCVRYFEEHEGTLLFTGENGVPLVRYHISDRGGVIPFDAMMARMRALGCDPICLAQEAGAGAIRELPFVYVFGRSHFAISYFGANVFPEMVSVGLEQPEVAPHVTGKFVMQVVTASDQNLELAIAVELATGREGSAELEERVARSILTHLLELDSEFGAYVPKDRQRPRITLHAAGDPEWFPVGVKHRYSR